MEAVMKIEHIALYANDLEGARKFFMKYLGAQSNDGYHNPRTNFRSYFPVSYTHLTLPTTPEV